jgi:hypothetical protein
VQEYLQRKYGLPFASNPLPTPIAQANGRIRRLRVSQHVYADDELEKLF